MELKEQKYHLYFFYGRIPTEQYRLRKSENKSFTEIIGKKFNSLQEAYNFLKDYVGVDHTFKDIGIAHYTNKRSLSIGATSVEHLLTRLERIINKNKENAI